MNADALGDCSDVGVSLIISSGAIWSQKPSEVEKEQWRILNVSERRIESSSSMALIFLTAGGRITWAFHASSPFQLHVFTIR